MCVLYIWFFLFVDFPSFPPQCIELMGDGCLNNEHFEEMGGILKSKLEEHFKNQELRQGELYLEDFKNSFFFIKLKCKIISVTFFLQLKDKMRIMMSKLKKHYKMRWACFYTRFCTSLNMIHSDVMHNFHLDIMTSILSSSPRMRMMCTFSLRCQTFCMRCSALTKKKFFPGLSSFCS